MTRVVAVAAYGLTPTNMPQPTYSVRAARYASDRLSDGIESYPPHACPKGFVPQFYGVYATDPEDGTDHSVADFGDEFRARQYAALFAAPQLGATRRNFYRCRACGYEWSEVD